MGITSFQARLFISVGTLGFLAVALGAFGAHGLKNLLSSGALATYETGITYHFYHVLALFMVALFSKYSSSKMCRWAAISFILGIIFFSGSLYLLAVRELIGLTNYKWLGPLTPLGGLFFITGWITIAIEGIKALRKEAAN